ncbi:MAG: beta-lactamase family protein [Oscillospiraceae bacterium]|nr:beta-lactamase family protein [Oscillospiraceae bacterium]
MKTSKKIFFLILSLIFMFVAFFGTAPEISAASDIDYHTLNYDEISAEIEKDIADYHIPGMAVIVVDPENVLFSKAYGNCPDIDTPFIIGSMSKSFTALSIMQLAEEGKINLSDPISEYIDCTGLLKNPSEGNEITVYELLHHTSGLDTNHYYGTAKITDSRGSFVYSNIGYGLLGKIVEAVSGKTYEEYVTENIFTPLEMNRTSASLDRAKENGLIPGYRNYFGIFVSGEADYPDGTSPSETSAPDSTVPAGYIAASANDMGKYLQMYLKAGNGKTSRIISPESIDAMFYDRVPQDDTGINFYGSGWAYTEYYGYPLLNHSGLVENYTSNMFIIPEKQIGIAVLVNMNDYFVDNNLLGNMTLPLLGEEKASLPKHAYTLFHLLIDLVYLFVFVSAVYPIIALKKWKAKAVTKKSIAFDILRHGALPLLLLALPYILGSPLWLVWYFVKDLFLVLTISSALLILTGCCKLIYRLKSPVK